MTPVCSGSSFFISNDSGKSAPGAVLFFSLMTPGLLRVKTRTLPDSRGTTKFSVEYEGGKG